MNHCSVSDQSLFLDKGTDFSFLLLPNWLWSNYKFMTNMYQGCKSLA